MGRYYDKLHFYLKRKLDRLSPRVQRRLMITLLTVYGLLSCYFMVKPLVERNKKKSPMEKLIDSTIRTGRDSVIIIKPIKKPDKNYGKG
ncbi:MAG: TraL conjugative transposon family protein [Bacteroidota bacterium]|nr:TraL conjugative transposon family protein [Bacteroidota bacterium]